ncbi:MAG: MBOAT family protein [Planctomycetes bacterium]|nr:MBOAT family protein [Planctomycetota bacterium]
MLFTDFTFLFWFLPAFFAVYALLPLPLKNLLLTLASYAFYGWKRPEWVILLLVSTLVDFVVSRAMGGLEGNPRRRKLLLLVSVSSNLGLLGYFKYANLLVDTAAILCGQVDRWSWTDVLLPVGISFYTFQSLSYTIDVYRGRVPPVRSFLDLACFVSMFPQLVAGPIVRYRDVAEQLRHRVHTLAGFATGTQLFMVGFVKKVLVADNAVFLADRVFATTQPEHLGAPGAVEAWTGILAYSVQIYFDFSGYSDMAIGLGSMLAFRFPKNFDSPYKSCSVTETWQRWHVSLSAWLRDYLYVPLGGNRRGELRTYVNLFLTMLLGGLWHGALWTKVLWGAYNGLLLAFERLTGRQPVYASWPRPLRIAITFVIWLIGLTIFRAESMASLGTVYAGMFGAAGSGDWLVATRSNEIAYTALVTGLVIAFAAPQSWDIVRRYRVTTMLGINALFVLALAQSLSRGHAPFIYFQF